MSNGKPINVTSAKQIIRKYVDDTVAQTSTPEENLVVGHLFDFELIKGFIDSVSELIKQGENISGVRVYHAKSNRDGAISKVENDLVLVPVLSDGNDYYNVYPPRPALVSPLIVGNSTPCPNVCNNKNLNCP